MYIKSYHNEDDINFIRDAHYEIELESIKAVINTNLPEFKIVVGKHISSSRLHRYNILLKKQGRAVAVLQLIHRRLMTEDHKMICEPHSFTEQHHRGHGYAEMLYRWVLDNNIVLRSCDHQTNASHGLWKKLGQSYRLSFFDNINKTYETEHSLYQKKVLMELSVY